MKKYSVSILTPPEAVYALETDQDISLLELMHQHQLPVRKACRNGACGICRCQLVAGEITYKQRQPFALWQEDIARGIILPCIAFAQTDVIVSDVPLQLPKK
ncbi:2Fe-2S iron-sulfur cluster binding domain-containing protein [Aestuariicella hydrocarbonica]|uniref:2Fe-2S iron-sulfur cluster binding domain-containing protein n=1 Tax=Pseudomaricurvus hydrocarbonicus TaxID=1470433 RepID=A0A9E5MMK9_9GAMM|nr:2Fe-2S iron-sulfur cluster-binding protein [Aestuariicella hydrocarbonica]NHO67013.1 2Fe-2S iron-sulfur cluster binding domain-containing protein [Aestuariicella hydrocarbonica]